MWQTIFMSIGTGIIKLTMPLITKELRNLMTDSLKTWHEYAKKTPYNWDNLLVEAIQGVLCITDEQLGVEFDTPGVIGEEDPNKPAG